MIVLRFDILIFSKSLFNGLPGLSCRGPPLPGEDLRLAHLPVLAPPAAIPEQPRQPPLGNALGGDPPPRAAAPGHSASSPPGAVYR